MHGSTVVVTLLYAVIVLGVGMGNESNRIIICAAYSPASPIIAMSFTLSTNKQTIINFKSFLFLLFGVCDCDVVSDSEMSVSELFVPSYVSPMETPF